MIIYLKVNRYVIHARELLSCIKLKFPPCLATSCQILEVVQVGNHVGLGRRPAGDRSVDIVVGGAVDACIDLTAHHGSRYATLGWLQEVGL